MTHCEFFRGRFLLCCALMLLAGTNLTLAGDGIRAVFVEDLRNTQTPFMVHVTVDHADHVYEVGETMTVTVTSEQSGYLYLFYIQADNNVATLFPNEIHTDNSIQAKKTISVPASNAEFQLRIGAPTGKELLKAIVTKSPLKNIELENAKKNLITPIKEEGVRAVYVELKAGKPTWAEHETEITTYPQGGRPQVRRPRRVAVCIGISEFADRRIRNLHVCHLDAIAIAELLRTSCGFDKVIVLTNGNATKQAVEDVIRQKLVNETQPGDEIVIYWSGHGARIADTSGDEKDGIDELLVPADADATNLHTVASTMISDDAFGRWIQALSGRRVLVVLDTCHSGGQANNEKGLLVDEIGQVKALPIDDSSFLDGELSRTKDIGQRDVALLSSSSAREISFERREGDLSVMTYYFIKKIKSTSKKVELVELHQSLQRDVRDYVNRSFRNGRQTPKLMSDIANPFYVKP